MNEAETGYTQLNEPIAPSENNGRGLRFLIDFASIVVVGSFICLWVFLGFKAFALASGIGSLLMYATVTVTTLCNSFIGRAINPKADLFWRYLFSFLATIFLTIGILA